MLLTYPCFHGKFQFWHEWYCLTKKPVFHWKKNQLVLVWPSTPFSFSSISFSSLDQLVPCRKKLRLLEKGAERTCLLPLCSLLCVPWTFSHWPFLHRDPADCRFSGQPLPPALRLHHRTSTMGQDQTTDPILTPHQRGRLAAGNGSTSAGVGRLWSSINTVRFVTLHFCSLVLSAVSELSNIE